MKRKKTYVTNQSGDSIADRLARIAELQEENRQLERTKKKNDRIIHENYRKIIEEQSTGRLAGSILPAPPALPKKEKFGTLSCDYEFLYDLLTNDYQVIRPMPINDFKLAFSGPSDPSAPIICLNVRLFINILHWIQAKKWLPVGKLNNAVFEQCVNRDNLKIDKHNIEEELSRSRNHDIHIKTEEIIEKLSRKLRND